ncbi:MAG: Stp1/IreP family PP2C-type Ser/Thr phosphatase [Clostridia bacterium]|nr:Stp1/IreP family PP2C-type Ser/Thr phosphatase [Clostridia bacterium]
MKAYYQTHVGLVRDQNEDTVLVDERQGLYILADGMGGHQAGEVASLLAAQVLSGSLEGKSPSREELLRGFHAANSAVYERQKKDTALSGMGTTLTVLWEDGDHVLLGHVGDSRAYLFRDGRLHQVSEDHSLVGQMLREGVIDEEQARRHPLRNVITRAVGTEETVRADVSEWPLQPGEKWLLCSDGLTDMVEDAEIERTLGSLPCSEAADRLISLALLSGGHDNVSVLLAEVSL